MKTSVKKAIVLFLLFVFSASNISSSIVFGYEAYGIMLDGEENQYTLADNHDGWWTSFNWRDISTNAENLVVDSSIEPFNEYNTYYVGTDDFSFPIFWESTSYVYTNPWSGRITFDGGYVIHLSEPLVQEWDVFSEWKVYSFFDSQKRQQIIQFKDMVTLETQQSLNFEIIIEETGKFILQYQNEMIGRQVSMGDRYDSDNTIYYWDPEEAKLVPANTAIHIFRNTHEINLEIPKNRNVSLWTPTIITGTGSNMGNDPISYAWSIDSVPEWTKLTEENLSGKNTSQIEFEADIPGEYVFTLRATNALPDFQDKYTEKTIKIRAYGTIFFRESNFSNPVSISDAEGEVFLQITGENFNYTGSVSAKLSTHISSDSEDYILHAVWSTYRSGPILVERNTEWIPWNSVLELGDTDEVTIDFAPSRKKKQDFGANSWTGTNYAGSRSISYAEMNKRDVFEKYSSILTNINGNLLLRDSEAAGSVAVFGTNPLTESALSTYDIPNGKSLGNDGSEFYTPDNIHYYDYGNFQSEYSMNSEYLNVLRLDGSQIVNDRLSMPSGINRIKSMVATGDNEWIIYQGDGAPLKKYSIVGQSIVLGGDVNFWSLPQSGYYATTIVRMLALDTEGDLLLISAKELSNNSYELTIHKMDKTILAGEDAAFTEENLILDQTISTGDIYNRYSPLQSLVIQSQDSFWIKEDAGHITEVDISSNTVRSYEAPNGFDSFAFDIESNKLLAISEYSNDSDREYSDLHESDLNVCSVSKWESNWECVYLDVSFEENGYLTKFRAPDEIRSDTYVQNLHSFFFTTDIGIVQYSLLNKSFTPSVEPTDSTSFDTLQDSYEDPINIVRNIGFDDDEYEITDPPADPCTECGTYYWKGWNEQVFTMDAGDELGEDDSLEITWKGFNTIATLDAWKNDIYLEVYNHTTLAWDIWDQRLDNTQETDFELKAIYTKQGAIPYLKDNKVTYRVREYEATKSDGFSLHTNYVYIAQNTSTPAAPPVPVIVNTAPVLDPIADRTIFLGDSVNLTVHATDADVPANTLTYSLISSHTGSSINGSSGLFGWTPTSTGSFTVSVAATDDGTPNMSATGSFNVIVNPVVVPPITPPAPGSGGGGGWSPIDICPNGDTSPSYYDGICSITSNVKQVIEVKDLFFTGNQKETIRGKLMGKVNFNTTPLIYFTNDIVSGNTLNVSTDGRFTFTPSEKFIGKFSFTYQAKSDTAISNIWTVTIQINPLVLGSAPSVQVNMPNTGDNSVACNYTDRDFSKLNFKDISTNRWKSDIKLLVTNCIVNGRSMEEFEPLDFATRVEFTKVALRSTGIQYDFKGTRSYFVDIPLNDWKTGVTAKALNLNLVKWIHRKDGRYFEWDRAITKKEALIILVRALQIGESLPKRSRTFEDYQKELRKYGVTDNLLSDEYLTREEMVRIASTAFRKRYPLIAAEDTKKS